MQARLGKVVYPLVGSLISLSLLMISEPSTSQIQNPKIDMDGYFQVAQEAAVHRESRRISEAEFLRLSQKPGTVILDARSAEKFNLLHIKGAVNLSFPDIDELSVRRILSDKNAVILIYCNNNFENNQVAFPSKLPSASLNISTYIALYNYGYRNIYELGPLLDVNTTQLPLVSGSVSLR